MRYISALAFATLMYLSADVAHAAGAHGGELNWGDFALRMVNAVIFVGLIWHFSGKGIKKFLSDHKAQAVNSLEDAKNMKLEATKQLEEATERLNSIQAECEKLLAEGKKQAESMGQMIISDAEKQAARIIEQAKNAAQHEGAQERARIQAKLADEIVAEVEKNLASRLNESQHLKLVEKSLSKVVLS